MLIGYARVFRGRRRGSRRITSITVLGMVAEFEADLIHAKTRKGMAVAKAKGRLRGKQPKLSNSHEAHPISLHQGGVHTTTEIAELFGIARSYGLPRHPTINTKAAEVTNRAAKRPPFITASHRF